MNLSYYFGDYAALPNLANSLLISQMEKRLSYIMPKKQNSRFAKELGDIDPPWMRIEDFGKRKFKRPVVLINGTFDILHSGHIKLVAHARKHGKTVVVAIDSDAMVGNKKPGRPFMSWVERAVAFRFLPIDYIVEVSSDADFKRLVQLLQPDLRVRGAEYANCPSRIPDIPSLYIHDSGIHTSEIIKRIELAHSKSHPGRPGGAQDRNGVGDQYDDTLRSIAEYEGFKEASGSEEPIKQPRSRRKSVGCRPVE